MIDPDKPRRIRFQAEDQPDLPEISKQEIEAERELKRRRKEKTRQWLEEHFDWLPFGEVW
ncbi:MAG: hypothetical protein IK144_11910 [Bacteroidaceae bacterium]|nr:hypothetical protein [Bacteroidaceae bacterium]